MFAKICGLFAMSEIAVGSLFRVFGGALAGGALLRIYGIQRGRMVPLFLYVPRGGYRRSYEQQRFAEAYCLGWSFIPSSVCASVFAQSVGGGGSC